MPIDFGLNFTDKRFLNKDGSFNKTRGYSNRIVTINNDLSINYHYSDRLYHNDISFNLTSVHFLFYSKGTNIGGFSKRLFSLTGLPFDDTKDFAYNSMLLTRESFMEKLLLAEEYKPIFEWCTWNLL